MFTKTVAEKPLSNEKNIKIMIRRIYSPDCVRKETGTDKTNPIY